MFISVCVRVCLCACVCALGPGKDTATTLEVYWPDGRSVARHLEPWEINTVLHVPYPNEVEEEAATATADIEVQTHPETQHARLC